MDYAFLRWPNFLDKAFTVSYDDGFVYDRRLIEILSKYGVKGTFNLNTGRFGDHSFRQRIEVDEIKALYLDNGHEIATHGSHHYVLTAVPDQVVMDEIVADRVFLEKIANEPIHGHAYPNGKYDDRVVDILEKCGIYYARTIEKTHTFKIPTDWLRLPATCHHNDPMLMELADEFLLGPKSSHRFLAEPLLFYVWGHSYEFDDNDNWHVIEDLCKKVGNRKDVWYATNIEVYRYVKAYEALEFGADGKTVYNPSGTDVYLNYFGNQIVALAGQSVKVESIG